MARPVFFITLGALVGAVIGMINGGGEFGRKIADGLVDGGMSAARMLQVAPDLSARADARPVVTQFAFSACLSKAGRNVEDTLRDLLEFQEHDATLALVGCLLDGTPEHFCTAAGRRQVVDAMEIYFWSRDDARRASLAHALAGKIHWLNRAASAGDPTDNRDPFAFSWTGPDDKAVFDRLKSLVKQGYLDPGAFAFSGRAELREALQGVTPEASPCLAAAQN